MADKGYDADYIVEAIEKSGAIAVIPPRSNRKNPRDYDKELYKERNVVERLFNWMKHYRGFATRYEKTAINFSGIMYFVATMIWLR